MASIPFAEALSYVKAQLALDDALPMKTAIRQANELMGLPNEGSAPDQVQALLEAVGVPPEPSQPAAMPEQPLYSEQPQPSYSAPPQQGAATDPVNLLAATMSKRHLVDTISELVQLVPDDRPPSYDQHYQQHYEPPHYADGPSSYPPDDYYAGGGGS